MPTNVKKRTSKTLYEKRGSKYIPVGKDDFVMPYGVGDYIVRIRRGSTRIKWYKKPVSVDYGKLEVLLDEAAEAICTAIQKVSELRPKTLGWTEKECRAWEEYKKIAGADSSLTFSGTSCWEMALKASEVLRDNLRKRAVDDNGVKECPKGCADIWAERE